jgi:uncharacterized protein (DUF433 family)
MRTNSITPAYRSADRHLATCLPDRQLPVYGVSVDLGPLTDQRAGVRAGNPCFVGTRIGVVDVLKYLAAGMTTAEIVVDYPELTVDHVQAAIVFAARREHQLASPN